MTGTTDSAGLTVAIALSAGIVASGMARHLAIPGIVLLLGTGILLGPEFVGLVDPHSLGSALHTVIGFAVAVILFEGGMSLDIQRLRREARVIQRLVLIGALVTTVGASAGAFLFLGWDLQLSVLFGTLVIVTGPTVVNPLLRRVKVNRNVSTILEAEGIFGDAVGALIAIAALEVVLADSGLSMVSGVASFPFRMGVGAAVGFVAGALVSLLLSRRRWVPEGLENVPRGIVAAAVASLFALKLEEAGIEGGPALRALVFLVIAVTVILQGMSAGLVARLLGVRRKNNDGFLVVGANPLGRTLARASSAAGESVLLLDANPHSCRAAEEEGLRVVFGNALEERTMIRAEADTRRGGVAVTSNEGVNVLAVRMLREIFQVQATFAAVNSKSIGVTPASAHDAGAAVLFGAPRDLDAWISRMGSGGAPIERWRLARKPPKNEPQLPFPEVMLPLVRKRGSYIEPVGDTFRAPAAADEVWLVILPERLSEGHDWLRVQGWEPVEAKPALVIPVRPPARLAAGIRRTER